jgi:hypothetical protein
MISIANGSNFIKLDLKKIIESVNFKSTIEIPDPTLTRTYVFTVAAFPGPGKFSNTFVIQIKPRIVFINDTGIPLYFKLGGQQRQSLTTFGNNNSASNKDVIISIDKDEQMPFHWPCVKDKLNNFILFSTSENSHRWSPSIHVNKISYFQVVLPYETSHIVITVSINIHDGRFFIQFFNESFFHYQIQNDSDLSFQFFECDDNGNIVEEGIDNNLKILQAKSQMPYFPKHVHSTQKFVILKTVKGKDDKSNIAELKINMDQVKDYGYLSKQQHSPHIDVQILKNRNIGLTKLLRIGYSKVNVNATNYSMILALMKDFSQSINCSLKEIGISCLDSSPKALFYVSIKNTEVLASVQQGESKIEISLGMYNYVYVTR